MTKFHPRVFFVSNKSRQSFLCCNEIPPLLLDLCLQTCLCEGRIRSSFYPLVPESRSDTVELKEADLSAKDAGIQYHPCVCSKEFFRCRGILRQCSLHVAKLMLRLRVSYSPVAQLPTMPIREEGALLLSSASSFW